MCRRDRCAKNGDGVTPATECAASTNSEVELLRSNLINHRFTSALSCRDKSTLPWVCFCHECVSNMLSSSKPPLKLKYTKLRTSLCTLTQHTGSAQHLIHLHSCTSSSLHNLCQQRHAQRNAHFGSWRTWPRASSTRRPSFLSRKDSS